MGGPIAETTFPRAMHELILNREIYEKVLREAIPAARRFVWIATADLKDLHVHGPGKSFVPFTAVLADLVRRGVEVRIIHAKEPGPRFRRDFDAYPELFESERFEQILCPRMHMKCVIIDGKSAFLGSANLTGAGMGAKGEHRRNFELGVLTDDAGYLARLMAFFDAMWIGEHCPACQRRDVCPAPIA